MAKQNELEKHIARIKNKLSAADRVLLEQYIEAKVQNALDRQAAQLNIPATGDASMGSARIFGSLREHLHDNETAQERLRRKSAGDNKDDGMGSRPSREY